VLSAVFEFSFGDQKRIVAIRLGFGDSFGGLSGEKVLQADIASFEWDTRWSLAAPKSIFMTMFAGVTVATYFKTW